MKTKRNKTFSVKTWILIGFTLALVTFAALVGLGLIEVGEAGIKFLF